MREKFDEIEPKFNDNRKRTALLENAFPEKVDYTAFDKLKENLNLNYAKVSLIDQVEDNLSRSI